MKIPLNEFNTCSSFCLEKLRHSIEASILSPFRDRLKRKIFFYVNILRTDYSTTVNVTPNENGRVLSLYVHARLS